MTQGLLSIDPVWPQPERVVKRIEISARDSLGARRVAGPPGRRKNDICNGESPGADAATVRPSGRRRARLRKTIDRKTSRASFRGAAAPAGDQAVRPSGADGSPILLTHSKDAALANAGERGPPSACTDGGELSAGVVRRGKSDREGGPRLVGSLRRPYLDLMRTRWKTARSKATAPGPASARSSAAKFASTFPQGFPLVTTKRLHLKSIARELSGSPKATPTSPISRRTGCRSGTNGRLQPSSARSTANNARLGGPGRQTYDHIDWLIEEIRRNPDSRRLVSRPGTSPTSNGEAATLPLPVPVQCHRESCRASSTSARPTSFLASRSTSRATLCSPI